jgi:hypothetical protein
MEPESSLPCSQQPDMGPYPDRSSNNMEQGPWGTDSRSDSLEIGRLSWNRRYTAMLIGHHICKYITNYGT